MKSKCLILVSCILAVLLMACNSGASRVVVLQTAPSEVTQSEFVPGKNSILVYAGGDDQLYCEISDQKIVQELLDALLRRQSWSVVPETEFVSAEPEFYVDCQNGIAFSLISEVNQVQIGEKVDKTSGEYALLNPDPQLRVMPGELVKLFHKATEKD